jgi:hypothetical protein
MLSLTRDLVGLRDALPALRRGDYATIATDPDVWAWRRGEDAVVACNLSDRNVTVTGMQGTIRISTHRAHDASDVDGELALEPWEAVIVFTGAGR